MPPRQRPGRGLAGRRVDSQKLGNARVIAGKHQYEVAEEAGISFGYYAKIERGVGKPTAPVLASIARVLGVEVADLLASADDEPERVPA